MSTALQRLHDLRDGVRRRVIAGGLVIGVPLASAAILAASQVGGTLLVMAVAMVAVALLAGMLHASARGYDLRWVTRQLDTRVPALEDSSALLLEGDALTRLQSLQRARVAHRLLAGQVPDLRPAWPLPVIAGAWLGACVLVLASLNLGAPAAFEGQGPSTTPTPAGESSVTRITDVSLDITPPAYTGLAPRSERRLEGRAPEGSRLQWRLRFDPQPGSAHLLVHDGRSIELQRHGNEWQAEDLLQASMLYRVVVADAPPTDATLHRFDAISDQPPTIRVLLPEDNVAYAGPGQSHWPLLFEASDDYGLGDAQLHLTLARGSGELVDFTEFTREIDGDGDTTRRRYALDLDLVELGIGEGDDLVAQLRVADNREPEPQQSRSASVVLRWPPPTMGDVPGFDGLMQRVMPAYFSSQRQIIIDTEALIAQRMRLPNREFVERSNAIAAEQRLLRLRYGQFMGEEAEGGDHEHGHDDHHAHDHAAHDHAGHEHGTTTAAPRARTSNPLFADDAVHARDAHEEEDHDHHADDGHAHDPPGADTDAAAPGFGGSGDDVVAQFGHLHDLPEAATLLDPQTRAILREALSAMWAAEGHLRLGEAVSALPHEYRALEHIKQVQQSGRIYLARVGLELPPIDPTRRFSGDVEGVSDRRDPLQPADAGAVPLLALWRALEGAHPTAGEPPDFDAATQWVIEHQATLDDPLGLLAAIDTMQREPDCDACRERLQAALWPALPLPAAGVVPRTRVDEAGERYLDAIQPGGKR